MNPGRVWAGLLFLALGVLGILALAGALNWDAAVGEWWPVAIVGWPLSEMLAARRVSIDGVIVGAIGLTLLADERDWAIEGLAWTMLFFVIGAAILLVPIWRNKREAAGRAREGSSAAAGARISSDQPR